MRLPRKSAAVSGRHLSASASFGEGVIQLRVGRGRLLRWRTQERHGFVDVRGDPSCVDWLTVFVFV